MVQIIVYILETIFMCMMNSYNWKLNLPMKPHVLLLVGRSVGRLFGRSFIISFKDASIGVGALRNYHNWVEEEYNSRTN